MQALRRFFMNANVVAELFLFLRENKRLWLLPMLITLFLFGIIILVAQSSVVAPFIYSFF
jgi:hypothetical protein